MNQDPAYLSTTTTCRLLPRGVEALRIHPRASQGRSMQDRASELPRIPLLRASVNRDRAAIAVDRKCTQRPAVVGIHIAAQANRSTEELSPRNGRAAAHPLVQPQGRELRVEGGAKER